MSKTPRTDYENAKTYEYDRYDYNRMHDLAEQLETELADMREQFAEYVKAEDAIETAIETALDHELCKALTKHSELRKQAKEVLGL